MAARRMPAHPTTAASGRHQTPPVPPAPAQPTLITLNSLTATPVDGGVLLQWKSGREVSNLGYHVYRDGVRVTSSLVAGSALLAGPHTVLTAGGSYSWFDRTGTPSVPTRSKMSIFTARGRRTRRPARCRERFRPVWPASRPPGASPVRCSGQIGRAAVSRAVAGAGRHIVD